MILSVDNGKVGVSSSVDDGIRCCEVFVKTTAENGANKIARRERRVSILAGSEERKRCICSRNPISA